MAKKKVCAKKCTKKCAPKKKSCNKKVAPFDNRLSATESLQVSNEKPGIFSQVYNYFFPAR